jgi:antitoxin component of RelBE/YafQ-DinJ toxin-antitoxin module
MTKSSAFRVRIDPELHKEFIDTCKTQNIPASQVLRELMRTYINKYSRYVQNDVFEERH